MDVSEVNTDYVDLFNQMGALSAHDKPEAYAQLLDQILKTSQPDHLEANLIAYLISLVGGDATIKGVNASPEPLSLMASRPLLSTVITRISTLPSIDVKISIAQTAVSLLQPRVVSFEEQDSSLKLFLADLHESQQDYTTSAKTLQSINLDTSQRTVTETDKAQIWVRIARCYLEEDDPTAATTYINRAKNVLHNVTDKTIRLGFQLSQARILDSQRQFLDASTAYHRISFESVIDEDDRYQSLSAAIRCAVLAPAGPQRARTLARLYKDERAAQIEEYSILEKIFLDRLLSPDEVRAFANKLAPHQVAKTADGSTVLDRAVREHNLLGASRLYRNIGIDELGVLLGVDGEKAEQYAAQMIEQGRLAGHIDQIDRVIFFEGEGSGEKIKAGGQVNGIGGKELRRWDMNVQGLAEEVEKVTTMIQSQFPVSVMLSI